MEYTALVSDSRQAIPGCLFFCKGKQFKKEYLEAAIEKGALAYVSETDYNLSVPCILVPDIRTVMADYAKDFYGDPSSKLRMAGLTGTKGKTTVTTLIRGVLSACGRKTGLIGTTGVYIGDTYHHTVNTTPESYRLQKYFAEMVTQLVRVQKREECASVHDTVVDDDEFPFH